ncbi:MAG: hypothetical protein ACI4XJ_10190 [Eubacteriales bacterium]
MNEHIKQSIYEKLSSMESSNAEKIAALSDRISLTDYRSLVRTGESGEIWTDALQSALNEHEIIVIPASDTPYLIDRTVIIPSNRRIEADGAIIRQLPGILMTMLQNEHMKDGTHAPIDTADRDVNISITGGIWEESASSRCGCPDEKYHANMLFTNIESLTLTDMTFKHMAGFAVQTGDLKDGLFENIRFDKCYADGLHLNGNSENIVARHISGEVGDDLVALNVYDWQMSSYNFGPTRTVLCEDLDQAPSSPYKALRIEPGLYTYDDGSTVDCALYDAIIKNVRGIRTFKMYFQTPAYKIGTAPERGGVGSADNLFFEDITVDLCEPIDTFGPYVNSDPVRGSFAGFEIGSNIGYICFENIDLTLYKERFPYSYLVCVGPKSIRSGDHEVFDPYLSSKVGCLEMKNIRVNGAVPENYDGLVRTIEFDDVNSDGNSTAKGEIDSIIYIGPSGR